MSEEPTDTGVIRLEQVDDFIEHTAGIIGRCIRQVTVLSTDLEPDWLGGEAVTTALRRFSIGHRRSQVRILVTDASPPVQSRHPWLDLIRRLSRIEARVIKSEILDTEPMKGTFVLGDRSGIVYRSLDGGAWQGFAHYDDRPTVQRQLDVFDQYWRYSEESAEFRHLSI